MRPICVSEYGGGAAISQHKDEIEWETEIDPWGVRHYENYQSAMHERIWEQFSKRKYLWAKYVWCMFDFASDGRQEGDTKGQNDKGMATRERVPRIKVYSNAGRVELFVNGVSAGTVEQKAVGTMPSTIFIWDHVVIGIGGRNEIKAVAYFADGTSLEDYAFWTGEA